MHDREFKKKVWNTNWNSSKAAILPCFRACKYCANLTLIFSEVSAVLRRLLSHSSETLSYCIGRTSGCTGVSLWTSENGFLLWGQPGCHSQVAQGGCGVLGDGWKPSGQGPAQPLGGPAWAGGSDLTTSRGPVQPLSSVKPSVSITKEPFFLPLLPFTRCHPLPEQRAGPAVWWRWPVQTFPAGPCHQEILLCGQLWGSPRLDWNRGSPDRWAVLG